MMSYPIRTVHVYPSALETIRLPANFVQFLIQVTRGPRAYWGSAVSDCLGGSRSTLERANSGRIVESRNSSPERAEK